MRVLLRSCLAGCLVALLGLTATPAFAAKHEGKAPAVKKAEKSLYKRLGGYDAIAAVVDDFISRMAADPEMMKYFKKTDKATMNRFRQLLVDQFCEATGGPCVYTGRDMKTTHTGMKITEKDWNTAAGYLVATLDKFKVKKKEKDEVIAFVSGMKKDIVGQ